MFSLSEDGISIIDPFLDARVLKELNAELDLVFSSSHLALNGYAGHVICSNQNDKKLPLPTAVIRSVNLLELACDVSNLIEEQLPSKGRVLTALEVWQEENRSTPLFWHSDHREGAIRVFIYLKGGGAESGAFRYIKGSHRLAERELSRQSSKEQEKNKYYNSKPSSEFMEKQESNIVIAVASEGSAVLADTLGFHGNQPREKIRRILTMEFQPEHTKDYPRSDVYLPSSLLTPKVIKNISLFVNHANLSPHIYGADRLLVNKPTKQKKLLAKVVGKMINSLKVLQKSNS